ncbi:MAG TPA: urease accessory UreF family protein [Alphaproteobacteria bacterium]|nr:urease accessory UreF family protein [Alphaproteobacteria bacterium]
MTTPLRLFTVLQNGDSLFPSGLTSFSWGLEQLFDEGRVSDATHLRHVVEAQLRLRWASFDRAFLWASHGAGGDLDLVIRIDNLCAVSIAAKELREGSARAGQGLLAVHAKLGTSGAGNYRERITKGLAEGHLPIAQGLIWGALGIPKSEAEVLSAYGLVVGFAAAAIRLGLIGHIDSQRLIAAMAGTIEELARQPPPKLADVSSFTPATDIAAMRHELAERRLFAN